MNYCICCKAIVSRGSALCSLCRSPYLPECEHLSYSEAYEANRNVGLSCAFENCLHISNDISLLELQNAFIGLGRFGKKQHNDGVREVPRFGCEYPLRNPQLEEDEVIDPFDDYDLVQPSTSRPTLSTRMTASRINEDYLWDTARILSETGSIISKNDFGDDTKQTSQGKEWQCIFSGHQEEDELIDPFDDYDLVQPSTSRPTLSTRRTASRINEDYLRDIVRIISKTGSIISKNDSGNDTKQTSQGKEWQCTFCTFLNTSEVLICSVCCKSHPTGTETRKTAPVTIVPEIKPLHNSLLHLDDEDLVSNTEMFECAICLTEVEPGQGAILKDCLHQFCKQCLADAVEHSNDAEIKCPYRDDHYSCDSLLRDREIKALVKAEVYEQHVDRSITEAEKKIQNGFHCKTPNCIGWCIYEDNVNAFQCPTCAQENCLTCRAIHEGINCKQYQYMVRMDAEGDQNAKKTEEAIKKLIEIGEAMNCPGCKVVIMRKYGCDWLQCAACKMEICWVTKGPRWGSRGKGDTSGGCKCGVNGRRCHPQCNYCH